jgi:ribose transport system ATP-binding protein
MRLCYQLCFVMNPRLTMRGVTKRFGATQALRGVDLDVAGGEVLGLVGENGAGKSTLMKVLSGALRPDAGEMWLDGQPYAPASPIQSRRAGVAMIYQELSLAPHLTVEQNILLGIEPTLGPLVRQRRAEGVAREALTAIGADLPLSAPVRRLPPAQQQLVEIARAMATDCRVLVLDEPTSSLARREIERLFALVRRLRGQGLAIIYISHFLEEISAVCDRYTVLRDGRSVGGGAVEGAEHDRIVSLMVGRNVDELYPRNDHQPGDPILSLESVAGRTLPASATLELRRGEVLGVAGLIGAGRSELGEAICGVGGRVSGRILLDGQPLAIDSPRDAIRTGICLVPEDRRGRGIIAPMSVRDNLTLPTLR